MASKANVLGICMLYIFVCSVLADPRQETRQEYMNDRNKLLQIERMMSTGGRMHLTDREQIVNRKLVSLKQGEIERYRSAGDGQDFPPANHFVRARKDIEQSDVFKIIKLMPKGAALHVHDQAITDLRWIIENLTYEPHCFHCYLPDDSLQTRLANDPPPNEPGCQWLNTNETRYSSGNITQFDSRLYHAMSMDDLTTYPSQNAIWKKFYSCFSGLSGLFFSEIGFKKYFQQGLKDFLDDNVQYMEIRGLFNNVSRLDGSQLSAEWLVDAYSQAIAEFVHLNPDFVGAKMIPTVVRAEDKIEAKKGIADTIRWKKQYPSLIAGFDLVGQEDPGHSLLYFIDELLEPSQEGEQLTYMFHAGETNWIGEDVDTNLIDAILLNTTRIGHGYALLRHPAALKYVLQNNIAVEINPISNQVLGLVSDLRNHPGAVLMSMGAPVVISSDDPVLWGASGLSYDFYEAFMGLAGSWGDLGTLKTLAVDSIRFSSMNGSEKQIAMKVWSKKWQEFLDAVIQLYNLNICGNRLLC